MQKLLLCSTWFVCWEDIFVVEGRLRVGRKELVVKKRSATAASYHAGLTRHVAHRFVTINLDSGCGLVFR